MPARSDREAFRRAALPFGPLDLAVRRSARHDEASQLRNLYLGVAGAACGVDSAELAASFHCAPECVISHRTDLLEKLPAIRGAVSQFKRLTGVWLLSQWGFPGEYRVNDLFRMMGGQTNEALPSRKMGFVPSDSWKRWRSEADFLEALGSSPAKVEELVERLRTLSMTALVRDGAMIRVVRSGIADNESGLLFLDDKAVRPTAGKRLRDGGRYVIVEEVEPNVIFYETT